MFGLVFRLVPGATPKKPALRIDGPQPAVGVDAHPGDIVAHGPDAVALDLQPFGRHQHGQVGLAAGAGEGGGDVFDAARRVLHAHDEHVLGQPAFALAQIAGDAQCEALLAEQHVAAVAGAHAPDGVVLREMQNEAALDVQVGLAVQAAREFAAGAQLLQHRRTDVRHDAHIEHDVNAVRQFHADLAERRTDRPHGEGDHVHGAPLHGALEDLPGTAIAFFRRHPVIRRARVFAQCGADEGEIFRARDIVDGRAMIDAARPFCPGSSSATSPLSTASRVRRVFLLFRPIDPDNTLRLAHLRHLGNPFIQCSMLAHGNLLSTDVGCAVLTKKPQGVFSCGGSA